MNHHAYDPRFAQETSRLKNWVIAMCIASLAAAIGVYLGIHMGRFETYTACSEKGTITYPHSILLDEKALTIDCSTTPKHYGVSVRITQKELG